MGLGCFGENISPCTSVVTTYKEAPKPKEKQRRKAFFFSFNFFPEQRKIHIISPSLGSLSLLDGKVALLLYSRMPSN
ncbi:hypothetical protein AQUCO_01000002v1 [Aquilegia coerulea]|uniref:Uncharacterized protein n=1 Tax=Aquilegia coerulea TaxID=218851 RepID=A0A2G5E7R0_AQUCA|nr:hypothetical protein AQUCO_01000002v1 [Aquilegia coerulea]